MVFKPNYNQQRAERNRAKILAVARTAFAQSDTEVSMAEISRRAGVGMATLYRNFPDRRELAEAARLRRPELKVLFITGYARDAAQIGRMLGPDTELLTKPFTLESLAAKVRGLVERGYPA